jgi:hypothetical protein
MVMVPQTHSEASSGSGRNESYETSKEKETKECSLFGLGMETQTFRLSDFWDNSVFARCRAVEKFAVFVCAVSSFFRLFDVCT